MPKSNEELIKFDIVKVLESKGWKSGVNLFLNQSTPSGREADIILTSRNNKNNVLIVIEVKDKDKNLEKALNEQSIPYAQEWKAPIAYVADDSIIRTYHLLTGKPLLFNGTEIDFFITEEETYRYLKTNEYNDADRKIIISRSELIKLFSSINDELRKTHLQAGIERFGELCNILFLKLFSEQEEQRKRQGQPLRIKKTCLWDYFKDKYDAEGLLDHINKTVLEEFREEYDKDIFTSLQIKNPFILKKIIDRLDTHYLSEISSDALGDAFEFFLKAYLAKEKKDLGEYFTPRHIVRFLVKLANPQLGNRIYDPFCGTGGILIESYKHIKKWMALNKDNESKLTHETLFGHESTRNLCRIAKMNMILAGDGHNNIENLDSWENLVDEKRDVVITNMPFGWGSLAEGSKPVYCRSHQFAQDEYKKSDCCNKGGKQKCSQYLKIKEEIKECLKCQELVQRKRRNREEINDKYNKYYLNSLNANSLCIEHCFKAIDSKNTNARIVIIIPQGILTDKNFTKLRKFIYDNSYIEYIVALPQFAFKPYAEPHAVILYLTNIKQKGEKKREQKEVWHFEVKDDGFTKNKREKKEGQNDFDVFWNFKDSNEEEKIKNGFQKLEMSAVKSNDYISIPNVYKNYTFPNSPHELVSLGELVEEVDKRNDVNAPVWSLTGSQGFIEANKKWEERVASENTTDYKLVLPYHFAYDPIRISGRSFNFNNSEKVGCVSQSYTVFKIIDEQKIKPQYLFSLFQSEQFIEQAQNYCCGKTRRPSISFEDFGKIKIPIPLLEEQEKVIEEVNKFKENIQNAQKTIDNLNSSLSLSLSLSLI
ncbi:MAG: N-6 DNA methylase [Candidatus Moeniiplasma glomeromycotorum]|nr:N-6 DNA methylase [Candidatus Moeniiplasma glomeromycotorum]MCE8168486.1 N-6 DNA methylase [Candidatus Moeniiplasma glomeromycotorum]MCE8170008.1 N-6 DNA methylase [Candidatus Moeniiplasma glomeromycotorum]